MSASAITVDRVTKSFRLYHERNQYLKAAILRGRRARYDEFTALKDVSFDVPRGATLGIIGSNGSGKSTMLKCLAGILFPESGTVTVRGRLSALLELGAGFHPELTGRENVHLNGAILGLTRKEIQRRYDDIVDFAGLSEFIDTPVKNYSSGMTVRLGFAIAANVEPEILLIDEVLAVGDASFQRKCAEKIEEFRESGRTIVLVSHATGQVEQLCETALWLERGDVQMMGPAVEVVNAYTGASHGADTADDDGEFGQRWGTHEIQIASIDLLDESGDSTKVFNTLGPMRIRLNLVAHQPLRDPVVGVRIDTLQGTPLWSTNTRRRRHTVDLVDGPATVDVEIPSLTLMEGVYSLTASVTDHSESHEYDHWERRIRFDVRQTDIYDMGTVFMPSTFTSDAGSRRPTRA
jgi:ABC-2 type transport system ATP-binding protein